MTTTAIERFYARVYKSSPPYTIEKLKKMSRIKLFHTRMYHFPLPEDKRELLQEDNRTLKDFLGLHPSHYEDGNRYETVRVVLDELHIDPRDFRTLKIPKKHMLEMTIKEICPFYSDFMLLILDDILEKQYFWQRGFNGRRWVEKVELKKLMATKLRWEVKMYSNGKGYAQELKEFIKLYLDCGFELGEYPFLEKKFWNDILQDKHRYDTSWIGKKVKAWEEFNKEVEN